MGRVESEKGLEWSRRDEWDRTPSATDDPTAHAPQCAPQTPLLACGQPWGAREQGEGGEMVHS
eukprot:5276864-Alexandrium_andersonii.AAC.1